MFKNLFVVHEPVCPIEIEVMENYRNKEAEYHVKNSKVGYFIVNRGESRIDG
ncbi:MAG TPA: hypothetical protein VGK59_04485 [Ohtaekwangia sp.]